MRVKASERLVYEFLTWNRSFSLHSTVGMATHQLYISYTIVIDTIIVESLGFRKEKIIDGGESEK